jgi:hypothetical protein
MTKYYDWGRVKDMDSRKKSDINMSSTFAEQRKKKETHRHSKEFGIKQMGEEVNIDWGKAEGIYDAPMRKLAKIAAAEHKGEEAKDQEIAQENLKDEAEE